MKMVCINTYETRQSYVSSPKVKIVLALQQYKKSIFSHVTLPKCSLTEKRCFHWLELMNHVVKLHSISCKALFHADFQERAPRVT